MKSKDSKPYRREGFPDTTVPEKITPFTQEDLGNLLACTRSGCNCVECVRNENNTRDSLILNFGRITK